MLITALMWGVFLLCSALALGSAIGIFLMSVGVFDSMDKDREMCVLFAIFVIVLTLIGTGFTFAAIALGRNLL